MKKSDKTGPRLPALSGELIDFVEEHEENIPIDEHDLVGCQRAQTESYHAVSKRLAFEVSKRDAAKTFLTLVKARVEDRIRAEARDSGEKVTEGSVASKVILDSEVIEAEDLLLDAQRAVRDLEALRDAFQQRSVMLRDMASLWIANYYGDRATEGADSAVKRIRAENVKREYPSAKRGRG